MAQLITPVEIPDCLKRPEFEFCKVGWTKAQLEQSLPKIKDDTKAKDSLEQFKRPRGKGWETKTFKWDSPDLQEWIKAGGNFGIVAGSLHQYNGQECRLFIMDADNPPALAQAGFEDELPRETLRIKTGRTDPPGGHIYFITDLSSTKAHVEIPGYCHFKFYHSQCVGPGSLHPSGRRYELVDNSPPAYVDAETLARAIITTVKALSPDKVKLITDALEIPAKGKVEVEAEAKVKSHGQRLEDNVKTLEERKKQRAEQIQQREAQEEAAYNARKAQDKQLGDIEHDERINPCLRRLTATLISGKVSRFEQAIGYEGKPGEGEHHLRLSWATALVKSGYDDELIHALAQHFDDYNESRTNQQIASVKTYVAQGGDYHPCKTLKIYIPGDWCGGCRWTPPQAQGDGDTMTSCHVQANERSGTKKGTIQSPEIEAKAKKIIEDGEFPEFWVKVYQRRHLGDKHIALEMPSANLTANIRNSHGIAVMQVAGYSGDGKSHAVQTVAEQMGRWCDISGLSPMALLYHAGETVHGGMMVVMDDNRPDERQGDIIKRAQTQFKTGYKYKTIIKGKAIELRMPPGVQLLTTEVDADAEDQVLNRTLLSEVEGSLKKDLEIIEADLQRAETGEQPLDDPDIAVCQAAFDQLKSQTYIVTIPEAKKRIRWLERNKNQRANLRSYNIFMDLIRAYAVMRWPQRAHHQGGTGVMHLEATKQDFMDALELYHAVHKQMRNKLTSKEIDLIDLVKAAPRMRLSRQDAMSQMKPPISKGRLTHLVQGKDGQGGLLSKYPGFYLEDATETEADPGRGAGDYSTQHIRKKYLCLNEETESQKEAAQKEVDSDYRAAKWIED